MEYLNILKDHPQLLLLLGGLKMNKALIDTLNSYDTRLANIGLCIVIGSQVLFSALFRAILLYGLYLLTVGKLNA